MQGIGSIMMELFIMFAAAKIAGELFDRVGQPPVIGELLAGVAIGPHALGLIGQPAPDLLSAFRDEADARVALEAVYQLLSGLGAVVLLFFVGLESPLVDLLRVGRRATAIAVAGASLSFALGTGLAGLLGMPPVSGLFVGAMLASTSVGISARVFADLGQLGSRVARIVLGAAIIDDILGLLALTAVSAIGRTGGVDPLALGGVGLQALAFVVVAALVSTFAVRRFGLRVHALHVRDAPFVVAMTACLGLAALASRFGLAALVGAFLAGVAFAETRDQFELERRGSPVYELLVPFFFVLAGSRVDWRLLLDPSSLGLALAVVALAAAGKLVGCGLAAWGLGRWSMAAIGVGMIPRGEVSLIVATVGAAAGAVASTLFSTVVVMSVLTTLLVPPVLSLLFRSRRAEAVGPAREWQPAERVLPDF
jgi:Kef-type K+ transport system membrane component KefB